MKPCEEKTIKVFFSLESEATEEGKLSFEMYVTICVNTNQNTFSEPGCSVEWLRRIESWNKCKSSVIPLNGEVAYCLYSIVMLQLVINTPPDVNTIISLCFCLYHHNEKQGFMPWFQFVKSF